jgi:rRNA-processing protein FCF1
LKIVLDTNFLVVPIDMKIDIFEELMGYELVTLEECVEELERIRPEMVDFVRQKVSVVQESLKSQGVDDKIIEFASKHNAYIATSDKKLKAKAKALNIPIVFVRQKKYVVIPDV